MSTTNSDQSASLIGQKSAAGGFTVGLSTARFLDANSLDEPCTPLVSERPVSPASMPVADSAAQPVVDKQESDSCVTDYMSQLMDRIRGGVSPAKTSVVAATKAMPLSAESTVGQPTVLKPQDAVMEAPLTQEEFIPRKQAPEKLTDMNSLRKIANDSTRNAISSYAAKQKKSLNSSSLVCVGVSLAASVALCLLSQKLGDIVSIGAIGAVAFAVIGIVKMRIDSRKSR